MTHPSRPNILFIMTDQQRFDTVAALGNPLLRTPALDGLARDGMVFTRAYTPSPVCMPARYSLITGLPAHVTGCVDNMAMPQGQTSFMERLRDLGYQTHGVGKMHFTPDYRRLWGFEGRDFSEEGQEDDDYRRFLAVNGFDHVHEPHGVRSEMYYIPQPSQLPERLHHSTWTGDRAISFLESRDRDRPFMLWTSFIKPHPPFESPTPWNKLYRAAEMPVPFRPSGYENLLTYWNRVQNRYKYRDAGHDDLLARTTKAAYYACISFVDRQVGRILDALGTDAENTLVVFTSDHGELLGDYGSYGKRSMLDAACRVPLLTRWPRQLEAGGRCDAPASLLDLFPTFLAAAGGDDPPSPDGLSLLDLATNRAVGEDRVVFSQFQKGFLGLYMAVSRHWKYVYSAPDRHEWLFDMVCDVRETTNLADNPLYDEPLCAMRKTLISRFQRDGYEEPLDKDKWQRFPRPSFPQGQDGGLLFQDPPLTQERVDALGLYARPVTVSPEVAYRIIFPKPVED